MYTPVSKNTGPDPTLTPQDLARSFLAEAGKGRAHALRNAMTRVRELAQNDGISASLSGRIKDVDAIAEKSRRLACTPSQLLDIIGVRVLVPWTRNCYRLACLIRSDFEVLDTQEDDFISNPKANGYRALHMTIIGVNDLPIEVQLRTKWMHEAAERGRSARPRK